MAILDKFGEVSLNQALTGAGLGGFFFSSAIQLTADVAARFRDVGRGNNMALRMQVTEAFGGGGGTVDTTIVVSDDNDAGFFLTNLVTLAKVSNITDVLTLNATFIIPLSPIPDHLAVSGSPGRRYLGVTYLVGGGTYTTGKVTCEFGHWQDTPKPPIHGIAYKGP